MSECAAITIPDLPTQKDCVLTVTNCGSTNVKCDWYAFNITNTCYAAFMCDNSPF